MAPALPGARGLFSNLQDSLSKADKHRVRLHQRVWGVVADFRAIADSLASRPTRLQELVPTTPTWLGASAACRAGMGGVWFHATDPSISSIVWREPYPAHVQSSLVSTEHPTGALSISDLELMAMIAHKDVLARQACVAEQTIWMATETAPRYRGPPKVPRRQPPHAPFSSAITRCTNVNTAMWLLTTTSLVAPTSWQTTPVDVGTYPPNNYSHILTRVIHSLCLGDCFPWHAPPTPN